MLCAVLAASSLVAGAEPTLRLRAVTFFAGRQEPRDGQLVTKMPLYELLSLDARSMRGFGVEDGGLVLSLWGRLDTVASEGERTAADVDLGYAEGKLLDRRLTLRLGRQMVVAGASRAAYLDGLSASFSPWGPLGLTAYGGVPVVARFAAGRGDAIAGGRASYRPRFDTELGVSVLHLMDAGRIARQEVGLDGRFDTRIGLTLAGTLLWSTVEARLAEAELCATWQPSWAIFVSADVRRTAPDLFIPRSSIFSVFSMEQRDEVGGSAEVRPVRGLSLIADAHGFRSLDGSSGLRGGLRASYAPPRARGTLLSGELRAVSLDGDGYLSARLRAARPWGELLVTLDGEATWLRQPINGQSFSISAVATASYRLASAWHVSVSAIAGSTPQLERQLELLARLTYMLDLVSEGRR